MLFPSELTSLIVTVPSGSMVQLSTFGGGPGNLDFEKFADQVPAKPPAGMSLARTVSDSIRSEKARIVRRVFMADMIIQLNRLSTLFRGEIGFFKIQVENAGS